MFQKLKRFRPNHIAASLKASQTATSEQADLIRERMDFEYYRNVAELPYADQTELVKHYLGSGATKHLAPVPWFSPEHYLGTNSDVRESGINPFYHYLKWGWAEGRSPSEATPEGVVVYDYQEKIIAENMDGEFYLDQVNPGRTKILDPVKHYCAFGWHQNFDPHPDFSTQFYLEHNTDVARRGLNPYFHFLTEGKFEGRPRGRSNLQPTRPKAELPDEGGLRTGVVSMVKNEGDIIRIFAAHLLQMFDEIIFIDHQSQDDTKDVLQALAAQHPNIHLYELQEPGYIQDIVSNHILRNSDVLQDVDWMMFLDADEFLPFADKSEFKSFLADQSAHPIISFRWKNLIPANYWEYQVSDLKSHEFFVPEQLSPYTKVALQPAKLATQDYWVNQGNHSVSRAKGMDPMPVHDTGATLFHLPIRSANQLAIKLNQGVLSYLRRRTGNSSSVEGQHWFEILDKLSKEGTIRPELLNGVVRDYGRLEDKVAPLDHNALAEAGYTKRQITVGLAASLEGLPAAKDENLAELMFQLGGAFAASTQEQPEANVSHVTIKEGNQLVADRTSSQHRYSSLPPRSETETKRIADCFQSPEKTIFSLQADSYQEIRNLTPTAWGGHLPFMFSLASILQPRRFVELGSHHGASFLAYCQASQRAMSQTQAVAIDCWEGDIQAGFYDNQVFEDFKFLIRPYEDFARYIRSYFDDAVHHFEDGSIDLLHIDGLHTYAAVKNDFETWLPKMSAEGLIIFHDTNVHERDFGVWRLWEELTEIYPSTQFMHSHGLGLLYVGSNENSGVKTMVETMARPDVSSVLQGHFESLSQLSVKLSAQSFEKQQQEEQLQNLAAKEELFSKLRQRNSNLEAENLALRDALRVAQSKATS
jgi:hypothetical protein